MHTSVFCSKLSSKKSYSLSKTQYNISCLILSRFFQNHIQSILQNHIIVISILRKNCANAKKYCYYCDYCSLSLLAKNTSEQPMNSLSVSYILYKNQNQNHCWKIHTLSHFNLICYFVSELLTLLHKTAKFRIWGLY